MTHLTAEACINQAFHLIASLQVTDQPKQELEQKVSEATRFISKARQEIKESKNTTFKEVCGPVLDNLQSVIENVRSVAAASVQPSRTSQLPQQIKIRCSLKEGNQLFIRGSGSGLNWDRGIPMTKEAPDTWVWNAGAPLKKGTEYKFRINDKEWEDREGNRKVSDKNLDEKAPKFGAKFLAPMTSDAGRQAIAATKSQQISIDDSNSGEKSITIKCNLKEGSHLFIRGSDCGLNWDKGIRMRKTGPDTWEWTPDAALKKGTEYKFLVNDTVWEEGKANRSIKETNQDDRSPKFEAKYLDKTATIARAEPQAEAAAARLPSFHSLKHLRSEEAVAVATNGLMTAWKLIAVKDSSMAERYVRDSFNADCVQWGLQDIRNEAMQSASELKELGMQDLAAFIEDILPSIELRYSLALSKSIIETVKNDDAILAFPGMTEEVKKAVCAIRLELHNSNQAFIRENQLPINREAADFLETSISRLGASLQGFVPSDELRNKAEAHIAAHNLLLTLVNLSAHGKVNELANLSTYERDFFILHYYDDLQFDVNRFASKKPLIDNQAYASSVDDMGKRFKQEILPRLVDLSIEGTFENDKLIAKELKAMHGRIDPRVIEQIKRNRIELTENNTNHSELAKRNLTEVRKLFA